MQQFVPRLLLLLSCVIALGCAGTQRVELVNRPLGSDDMRSRLAVGSPTSGFQGDDDAERSGALAEFARRVGHRGVATSAALRHLRLALAAYRLDTLDGVKTRASRRALLRATDLAVEIGRWAGAPLLVVEAAMASPKPRRHQRALRSSVDELTYLSAGNVDSEALLARFERDPAVQATVHALSWTTDVPDALLSASPRHEPQLRARALTQAITEHDRERMLRHAKRLAEIDASDTRSRILILAAAEVDAGLLLPGASLWTDVMLRYASLATSARHRRRLAQFPRADSIVLAHAAGLLGQGLAGDAVQVMDGRQFQSDEAIDIAGLIRAVADTRAGDVRAYDGWRRAHPESYPLAADRAIAEMAPREGAAALLAAAAQARRRLIVSAPEPTQQTLAMSVLDEALPKSVRARASRKLRDSNVLLWSLLSACLEHDQVSEPERCRTLVRDHTEDDDWMLAAEVLVRYGRSGWVTPEWFAALSWWDPEQDWAQVTALLPYFDTTTVSTSAAYQEAAFVAELRGGKTAAAEARLSRVAAMLETSALLRAQLELRDVKDGRLPAKSVGTNYLSLTPLGRAADDTGVWGNGDDTSWSGRVGLASQTIREGEHGVAAGLLAKVADITTGRASAMVAARGAAVAFVAGDKQQAEALLQRLESLAPASAELAFVQALQAEHSGHAAQAATLYRLARRRAPDLRIAFEGEVAMLDAVASGVDVQALWSSRPPYSSIAGVTSAIHDGSLRTVAQLFEIQRAKADEARALALGPRRGERHELTYAAMRSAQDELKAATSVEAARSAARTIVAYLAGLSPERRASHRMGEIWARFLLGQTPRAMALCDQDAPTLGLSPLPHGSTVMLLVRAQADGLLSDADTLKAWRYGALNDDAALVQVLDAQPPRGAMLELACVHYAENDDFQHGKPTCLAAANVADSSANARGRYSYILMRTEPDGSPALEAFMTSDRARAHYDPADRTEVRDRDGQAILAHNRALWLEIHDHCDQAADLWVDALALGTQRSSEFPFSEACAVGLGELHRRWRYWGPEVSASDRALRLVTSAMRSADLIAAAHYSAETRAQFAGTPSNTATVATADRYDHLAALIQADLRDRALDAAALVELTTLVSGKPSFERRRAAHKAHPESRVTQLLLAEGHRARGDDVEARALVEKLLARAASNPAVVVVAAAVLSKTGELARAQQLYADARAEFPTAVTLVNATLPESVRGPYTGVPAWARDSTQFDARLSMVRDQDLTALSPRWRSHTDAAADAFFPAALEPRPRYPVAGYDDRNNRSFVTHDARASRCEGRACMEATLRSLLRGGGTLLWSREVQRPDGPAYEATVATATEIWNLLSIPAGSRVYHLVVAARHEDFADWMPTLRLLRESFAPLDRALQASRAASLRVGGAKLSEHARLRGRLAYYNRSAEEGCPVRQHLEMFGRADLRGEALLDLMLLAPDPAARRALLSCTPAESPEAARLALPALLDDDAWLHAYGLRATQVHARQVLRDVKDVLVSPLQPALAAADSFTRPDLPPHGLVEVALSLPKAEGRRFLATALDSTSKSERAMAWSAMRLDERLVLRDRVSEAVESVEVDGPNPVGLDASLRAIDVLAQHELESSLPLLRSRLDRIKRIDNVAALRLAESLVYAIASAVDDDDSARLRTATRRIMIGSPGVPRESSALLRRRVANHARALTLRVHPERAGKGDEGALRLLRARALGKKTGRVRTFKELATLPLPALLPGKDWAYTRITNPGLFASTVTDTLDRLSSGNTAHDVLAAKILRRRAHNLGLRMLTEENGIDLSEPIECATPDGADTMICSAALTDRETALSALARSPWGRPSGLMLPAVVADGVLRLPFAAAGLPTWLHTTLHEAVSPAKRPKKAPSTFAGAERVRVTWTETESTTFRAHAIVSQYDGSDSIDLKMAVVAGDRIFVMSGGAYVSTLRRAPVDGVLTLAEDPAFRRSVRGWKSGAALQTVWSGDTSPIPGGPVAMELVLDASGLSFRYSAAAFKDAHDASVARAMLPGGATSVLALGSTPLTEGLVVPARVLGRGDRPPPIDLLRPSKARALAWYPATGASLWGGWIGVAQLDKALRRTAKSAGFRLGSTTAAVTSDGVAYAERDGYLILASDVDLVARALATSVTGGSTTDALVVASGILDGAAAAEVVSGMVAPGRRGLTPRDIGSLLGLLDQMRFEARIDPTSGVAVLEGKARFNLRASEGTSSVIGQWLASKTVRNAVVLPRSVSDADVKGTLAFELEVPDAGAFVRESLNDSPRVRFIVRDATHVSVVVAAAPAGEPSDDPLSRSDREAKLSAAGGFRSSDPKILAVAATLTARGATPSQTADAALKFVNRRITYEVTPRWLNAVEILDTGRGDCSEYALLTVSLLRASGVPAEMRHGMVALGGEMVAHAWVAYHDGKHWTEVDPTAGTAGVTAGHIPVSVSDVLALLSLDAFKVAAIQASP